MPVYAKINPAYPELPTKVTTMRTVAIFNNNRNQAIRIPKDMAYIGVAELEIYKEGDTLILRPVRPSWLSLMEQPAPETDFMTEHPDVIEEGRFVLGGGDAGKS